MDAHGGFLDPDVAAAVFSQADAGVFHLALSGIAAELHADFVNLGKPGCANGMAAALQAPAGVDGLFAAKGGGAGFSIGAAFAHGAEAHGLGLVELPVGGCVVELCQVDVFRA